MLSTRTQIQNTRSHVWRRSAVGSCSKYEREGCWYAIDQKEKEQRDGQDRGTFGNFFRALRLKTRLELADEEWVYTEEPHVERRREILTRHPEIKKLMGPDPLIAVIVVAEVTVQFGVAY
ncbi:hypothetical protein TcWFU_005541 [Taenia crassiceps]|uniref:Sphingolipid delta4-desaturase N-terminal domain-containing protein n=1 Tax=Taenia crassiceps TaxID=6207 RepID=A0ABR4Q3F6_9CEST